MSDANDDDKKGTGAAEIVTGGALGAATLAGATHFMKDHTLESLGKRHDAVHTEFMKDLETHAIEHHGGAEKFGEAAKNKAHELIKKQAAGIDGFQVTDKVLAEYEGEYLPAAKQQLLQEHQARIEATHEPHAKIGDKSFADAKAAADAAHQDATKGMTPDAKAKATAIHDSEWDLKKKAAIAEHLQQGQGVTDAERKLAAGMKATKELEHKAVKIAASDGAFSRMKATFSGMSGGAKAAVCLGAAAVALGGGYLVNCWRNSGQPEGKQSLSGEQAGNFKQLNQQMGQGMARA